MGNPERHHRAGAVGKVPWRQLASRCVGVCARRLPADPRRIIRDFGRNFAVITGDALRPRPVRRAGSLVDRHLRVGFRPEVEMLSVSRTLL